MNSFVANGVRLAYRIDGPDDAPALVMLNSLGTDLRMWNPQAAMLSRNLRIIRYDCRGHGASDAPAGPYTIEQFGLDLLTLLDTLQIERAHLCGLSLGGLIALWFAAHYPGRVARAVFANTAARIGTVEGWNTRIAQVSEGGMGAVRDMVLARFLSEQFRQQHPEIVQQFSETLDAIDPQGYKGACAALREADLREKLAAVRAPSLIIAGELDEATPPSQARELHAAIAGSELSILREAAHLSNVEQPEAFSKAVSAFLVHS
ncbi:MAG TPA: 3-oxoadipate enol-lactonase [Ktedonobacterales bacterium]|jgi:3-oxoadipate enol-lactonase